MSRIFKSPSVLSELQKSLWKKITVERNDTLKAGQQIIIKFNEQCCEILSEEDEKDE